MLKITLRPRECVIVNGSVIRNGERRHALMFETHADIVREKDLLKKDKATTPVSQVYFFIQTALVRSDLREKLLPEIQKRLADLVTCFGFEMRQNLMEAANQVSIQDYYKALSKLRPVMSYEAELLALAPPQHRNVENRDVEHRTVFA